MSLLPEAERARKERLGYNLPSSLSCGETMGKLISSAEQIWAGWHSKHAEPRLAFQSLPSGMHRETPSGAAPADGSVPQGTRSSSVWGLGCSLLPTPCDLEEAPYSLGLSFLILNCGGDCVAIQSCG